MHLFHLKDFFTTASIPFLELGYLLLMMTCIQVSIFAVVLIMLPLFVRRWEGSHKLWTAVYFAALGLRLARKTNPLNISWAWSINGCSSVISVVLATIIAIEFGFVAVMAAGACMYGTAWAATYLMSSE